MYYFLYDLIVYSVINNLFLLLLNNVLIYLFICVLADGHLSDLQFLSITNKAAVVFTWTLAC